MTIEVMLKAYILSQYKSLRDFCIKNNYAYSTINNIFKRGINGSSVSLILSVCSCLNIDVNGLADGKIIEKQRVSLALTDQELALVNAYRNNAKMRPAVNMLLGIGDN